MKTNIIIQSTIAALALAFIPYSPAQTTVAAAAAAKDPYAAGKSAAPVTDPAPEPEVDPTVPMNIYLTYEAFSLPLVQASEIQRSGLTNAKLYEKLVAIAKLERLLVICQRSGQRANIEIVNEFIYPTEYSTLASQEDSSTSAPQEDSAKVDKPQKNAPAVRSALFGTAFTMRPAGDRIEIDPVILPGSKAVDITIAPEHTTYVKKDKWMHGAMEVEQPQFEVQKMTTAVTAAVGSPHLIGTMNPPFGNGLATRTEQNIWFCFITSRLVPAYGAAAK